MAKAMPAVNRWIERLWTATDAELDSVLDAFWREYEVRGAGMSLPTAVLYLRSPDRFNIWFGAMSQGLEVAAGFQPGPEKTASGYRHYNAAAMAFREHYGLAPQALDVVLCRIGEKENSLANLCRDTFLDAPFWEEVQKLLEDKQQIILYGPPGTGKTWLARQFARFWVDTAPEPGGAWQVVQFHPSYAYEEFVEGIRPQSEPAPDGRHQLTYRVRKGIFRLFCEQAKDHPNRRYVLILDEINRGELPRILGELLYLLEYREESVILPYSGEPFAIPDNVYLIGTMNTADRSIALVDHALRRRFHFVAVRPSPDVLRAYLEANGNWEMTWVARLLDEVNRRLEADGIEWHLHIGHSHFMRPDLDEAHLQLIWEHSVRPTLEEYFYRQPERLNDYELPVLKDRLGKA